MSHYVLKLVTGYDVYGKIDYDGGFEKNMVVLTDPMIWEEYVNEEGVSGSAMVKYIATTHERKIPVSISMIVSMARMNPVFKDFYDSAVDLTKITDKRYEDNIKRMTANMKEMIENLEAQERASETDDIVSVQSKTYH